MDNPTNSKDIQFVNEEIGGMVSDESFRKESVQMTLTQSEDMSMTHVVKPRRVFLHVNYQAKSIRGLNKQIIFPWKTFLIGIFLIIIGVSLFLVSLLIDLSNKTMPFFIIMGVISIFYIYFKAFLPGIYAFFVVIFSYFGVPGCSYRLIPFFERASRNKIRI